MTELPPAAVEPAPVASAPVEQAPELPTAPAAEMPESEPAQTPRPVDFAMVKTAFVDLYVASGRKPGSRAIEQAIKGHAGAPRKTTINEWMRAHPTTIAELTATAQKRLAAETKELA